MSIYWRLMQIFMQLNFFMWLNYSKILWNIVKCLQGPICLLDPKEQAGFNIYKQKSVSTWQITRWAVRYCYHVPPLTTHPGVKHAKNHGHPDRNPEVWLLMTCSLNSVQTGLEMLREKCCGRGHYTNSHASHLAQPALLSN